MVQTLDEAAERQDPLASQWLNFLLDGLFLLAHQPGVRRRVSHGHRELIIRRGRRGYLARHLFNARRQRVLVLSNRHQREAGYHDNEI